MGHVPTMAVTIKMLPIINAITPKTPVKACVMYNPESINATTILIALSNLPTFSFDIILMFCLFIYALPFTDHTKVNVAINSPAASLPSIFVSINTGSLVCIVSSIDFLILSPSSHVK